MINCILKITYIYAVTKRKNINKMSLINHRNATIDDLFLLCVISYEN